MKRLVAKFKSLPVKNKKILGLSVVVFLALLIPLLLWGFLTNTFDVRKRAGGPVTPPNLNALNWETETIRIEADDFYINAGGNIYTGNLSEVDISEEQSAVGNELRSKLSVNSTKDQSELRLEINFQTDSTTTWSVSSVRVYNSLYADKWVTYTAWPIETPLAQAKNFDGTYDFGLIDPFTNETIAFVHFSNLSIQAFTDLAPSTITCNNDPFILELSPQTQQGTPGQTVRYSVRLTNPNTDCEPYTTHLIADKPANWAIEFGSDTFSLAGNHTYDTHLDVTSATSDYLLGDQEIPIRVSTEEVGYMASGKVIYNLYEPTEPPVTPTPQPIPGDVDGDGRVNIVDIGIIIDNYRMTDPDDPRADVNGDGIVNIVDIGIVIDNYGR